MSWCLYPHTSDETHHCLWWGDFEAVPLECCLREALKETFLGLNVDSIFFL